MPRITDSLQTHQIKGSNFQYSAANIKDLGATEYTLVDIVVDASSSVYSFKNEMELCIKEVAEACKKSARADNLMIRLTQFADRASELHGYKLLSKINAADYDNILQVGGNTALYDASAEAIQACTDYGQQLNDADYNVNAIAIVMTDGCNNASVHGVGEVTKSLKAATKNEALESLVSILVAVNMQDPYSAQELDTFHKTAGFTQFIKLDDAKAKTLAKLAKFVSDSISSQSKALGSGGPSKSLIF